MVNQLNGAGINVLLSVVKAPNWARPGNTDFSVEGPPSNPQTYADFVGALASHYKGRVQAIEVWNEQNLWYEWGHEPLDPGRYVDLLCKAYSAIKAADPGMTVVSGALTPTGLNDGSTAIDDLTYLQRMYASGAKRCFDAVGAHPSGYNNPPDAKFGYSNPAEPSFKNHPSFFFRDTMERYRNVMVANGDCWQARLADRVRLGFDAKPRGRLRIRPRCGRRRAGSVHRARLPDDERLGLGRPGFPVEPQL